MTVSISQLAQLERAEYDLVDLISRLGPARSADCQLALTNLRKVKQGLLAQHPDVLRKRGNETGAGTTDTGRNPTHPAPHRGALLQAAHDHVHRASDGVACKAGAALSNERMTHLRLAADALHRCGAKCDAANPQPGGMPNADGESEGQGTYFDHEDKATAARAAGLAKRLGRPVSRPAGRSTFYWEANGARMGLDAIERRDETDRINAYRKTAGLVPLT